MNSLLSTIKLFRLQMKSKLTQSIARWAGVARTPQLGVVPHTSQATNEMIGDSEPLYINARLDFESIGELVCGAHTYHYGIRIGIQDQS